MGEDEYLRTIYPAACGHIIARPGPADGGRSGIYAAAGSADSAGGVSGNQRERGPAWREPGDHGFVSGNAAGAAIRTHRRGQPDDLDEPTGLNWHHAPVRSVTKYRRRGARRTS